MEKRSRMSERSRSGYAISAKKRRKLWWKKYRLPVSILCAGAVVLFAVILLKAFLPWKAALFFGISLFGFAAWLLLWIFGERWHGGLRKAVNSALLCIGFAFVSAGLSAVPGLYEQLGLKPIQLQGQRIETPAVLPPIDGLFTEAVDETAAGSTQTTGGLTVFRSRASAAGQRRSGPFGGAALRTISYQKAKGYFAAAKGTTLEGEQLFIAEAYSGIPVWVSSGNGSRYHMKPDCGGMKNARQLSVEQAVYEGYSPCSRCN